MMSYAPIIPRVEMSRPVVMVSTSVISNGLVCMARSPTKECVWSLQTLFSVIEQACQ